MHFLKKELFLSTYYVPKKGSINLHLHNEGQKNLGTPIRCSLKVDIKGKMTKNGQKFFLKKLRLQQFLSNPEMILYVARLMPQYILKPNQIVTWSLPNSVTWKK